MGAYAAVIPTWIAQFIGSEPVYINSNGETSRDFCYDLTASAALLFSLAHPCPSNSSSSYALNWKAACLCVYRQHRVGRVVHPEVADRRTATDLYHAGDEWLGARYYGAPENFSTIFTT